MLFEEFKRCINSDVKSFLDEKEVYLLKVFICYEAMT